LDVAERLEGLSLEDRIGDLSDEDRQALLNRLLDDPEGLTPAQRLLGFKQQLQGLSPEDIRDALSDDEHQVLRQLLDDQESDT
jgi:hypothetical protein